MEELDNVVDGTLTLAEEPNSLYFSTASMSSIYIAKTTFDKTEFCYQFDEDEPVVFALGGYGADNDKLNFTISNTSDGNITFTGPDNKTFKIFAREHNNG
jgi:hypothetical protein